MRTYITNKFHIIEISEPVGIVYHSCLVFAKLNKSAHLLFKTFTVVINIFYSKNFSKVASAGRITDHTCTAANQCYRLVSCHLKSFHQTKCHKMTYMQAVCRRVKSYIECGLTVIYHFAYFFFVCDLSNKPSGLKFFITIHIIHPYSIA